MTSKGLRLIRRVQGRLGSVGLYDHAKFGLAHILEVREGASHIIELQRLDREMLGPALVYLDEVQQGIDDVDAKTRLRSSRPAKRTRAPRLGDMYKRMRAECSPAAEAASKRKTGGGS